MIKPNCKFCNDTGIDEMTDSYRQFIRCDHCAAGIQAEIENRFLIIENCLDIIVNNINVVKQLQQTQVKKP